MEADSTRARRTLHSNASRITRENALPSARVISAEGSLAPQSLRVGESETEFAAAGGTHLTGGGEAKTMYEAEKGRGNEVLSGKGEGETTVGGGANAKYEVRSAQSRGESGGVKREVVGDAGERGREGWEAWKSEVHGHSGVNMLLGFLPREEFL